MRSAIVGALWIILVGCGSDPNDGGQTAEEGLGCLPDSITETGVDEVTPLGFSAEEVLAFATGSVSEPADYDTGLTTTVQLTVTATGDPVTFEERSWHQSTGGTEPLLEADPAACNDRIVIPVIVAVETEDGGFDESFETTLTASSLDAAATSMQFDPASVGGSYVVSDADAAGFDEIVLYFDAVFEAESSSGSIYGVGSAIDDDVASASNFPILSW